MVWAMWLAAGLTWSGTAYYLRSFLTRDRSPSLVFYWYALLFISIALTLVLPQVFSALNQWSRTPNLSRLVANSATVLAALCVQNAVLWSLVGDSVRFRLQWVQTSVAAATVTAIVALFFTIGRLPDAWEFSDYYHLGNVAAYRFVYLGYMGIAALVLTVIWARFAIASVDLRLKTEFSLLAVGGATGLAYLANDAGVVAKALGWNSPSWWANERYTSLLIGVAVTLMFLGATTPGWLHLIHSIRAHLAFLRLRRLWLTLRAAVPQVVLISVNPLWKDLLDPRGATFKLHRQVVEIRDALLLLRRSTDPSSQEVANTVASVMHLDESESLALSDAALVWQATNGRRPDRVGRPPAKLGSGSLPPAGPRAAGFWREVAQLSAVARHLRDSAAMQELKLRISEGTNSAVPNRELETNPR